MVLVVNGKDITAMVGNISLDSNTDTLGDQLNFEMAYVNYLNHQVDVGDVVQLFDIKKEVFVGVVVAKNIKERSRDFICFDFAFYLNKSKVIKQFNNVSADAAIKQLLTEFSVPIGSIAPMKTIIKKIYYDKEVSEVIKDIMEEVKKATGIRYIMEMNRGKLEIYKAADKVVKATVKLADNVAPIDCMTTISSPSKSRSIEEMKNSIKLYVGNESKVQVYAEAKNDSLISKYGLLQETQSLEEKNIAQAKNIANNLLKELGKVVETAEITVLGNFDLRAGRIVEVHEPSTEISGKYRIKSCNHEIGALHKTTLELEVV
ncbi:XkdQ/YqbQ family protein [Anaerotignum sp. MB30-C6]|uniref:XkdQ/YqbQ family protein n=1 Tax=Anaerotignum sp. MB30-C6 TaxID=3070814 RepID=UPI0027DCBBE2|nr:hypothetical protein [Anaerotignum sp. MB30-C6]WMI80898.1 hypothetical protein RBQ60_13925 [Anaerotignum sp. MB30-C6]